MAKWLDTVASAARAPIWLDDTAYTARLLAGGRAPWLDVAAYAGWRRKALQLLEPAISVLDVEALMVACINERADLLAQVRLKHEPVEPLRVVLADERLREQATELARVIRASTTRPLALVCPTPRRWLTEIFKLAFNESIDPDADEMDDAASYCASFLRAFGTVGIDTLLLRGAASPNAGDAAVANVAAEEWSCYGSLVNLARHYRWDLGLQTAAHDSIDLPGLDFLIAPSGGLGVALDSGFWNGAAPPSLPPGSFAYATIPAEADPASVLERLRMLR